MGLRKHVVGDYFCNDIGWGITVKGVKRAKNANNSSGNKKGGEGSAI